MRSFCRSLIFMLVLCAGSSEAQEHNDPVPEHETFTIASERVGETRTINVWTPPEYKTGFLPLPVLYMPDGGLKEDFPHVANTLAKLIAGKKIRPVILVGIENTQRRRDLTGPTTVAEDKRIAPVVGGSGEFRAFLKDELLPEIGKRYRTTREKVIIGESLAGLFVMETFFLEPGLFDSYIAFDPSLWWNDHYLMRTARQRLSVPAATRKKLWFTCSGTPEISLYTRRLFAILHAESNASLSWTYADRPKETHATIFRAMEEQALVWTLRIK